MILDKSLLTGSTTMLLLKLMEQEDLYGYLMIEKLKLKSNNVFELKAGTLYPLLHTFEQKGLVNSYEIADSARIRKYYSITDKGLKMLKSREYEWKTHVSAVKDVIGGVSFVYE